MNAISYQKRNFRGASTNEKHAGISVLIAKETILRKINGSFCVHFFHGKYSFILDTFSEHLVQKMSHDIIMNVSFNLIFIHKSCHDFYYKV